MKGGRKIFALPRLHPKETMGRNESCWCLSGKKWKHCHRDREALSPVNVFESFEAMRETFAEGYCLHPESSAATCSGITKAHTIQKRGGLAAIAEDSHVLSVKDAYFHNTGETLKRVGINKASTFPGFCNTHDSEMFREAEYGDVPINHTTAFLLSYRAIAYEYFTKEAAIRSIPILRDGDRSRPFLTQCPSEEILNPMNHL